MQCIQFKIIFYIPNILCRFSSTSVLQYFLISNIQFLQAIIIWIRNSRFKVPQCLFCALLLTFMSHEYNLHVCFPNGCVLHTTYKFNLEKFF